MEDHHAMRSSKASHAVIALISLASLGIAPALSPAAAEELTFHYTFAAPLWERAAFAPGDEIPSIAGTRTLGQAGEPLLPVGSARILLPPGEEIVDVRVVPEAVAETSAHLPAPAQKEYPLSFEGPIAPTGPDAAIYASNELFPAQAGRLANPIQLC